MAEPIFFSQYPQWISHQKCGFIETMHTSRLYVGHACQNPFHDILISKDIWKDISSFNQDTYGKHGIGSAVTELVSDIMV